MHTTSTSTRPSTGSEHARSPLASPAPEVGATTGAPRALARATFLVVGLLAVAALIAGLVVGGGRPGPVTPGLPDAGAVTGWGLPLAELLSRITAIGTVGTLLLAAVLTPAGGRRLEETPVRAVRAAGWWAAAWAVATAVAALFTLSSLLGVRLVVVPVSSLTGFVSDVAPGRSAALVVLLLSGVALGARRCRRRSVAVALLAVALVALLVPVVLSGHSAAAEDHLLAVSGIGVHVVAATLWMGGLLAVVLAARGLGPLLVGTVQRFSSLALVCFVVVGLSGVLSSAVLLGGVGGLLDGVDSDYGRLLLAKAGALALLGAFGAWHRARTLRSLRLGRPGAFRRIALAELAIMAGTVGLAVALAASPPPVGDTTVSAGGTGVSDPAGAAGPAEAAPTEAPDLAAAADAADLAETPEPPVEDMSGHDHGELSVGVLVDTDRFHVSGPVSPGQLVTFFSSNTVATSITADDGAFDVVVRPGALSTFPAPEVPGVYRFSSSHDPRFVDVLVVRDD